MVLGTLGFVLHRTGEFIATSPFTTMVVVVAIYMGYFKTRGTQIFVEEAIRGMASGVLKAMEGERGVVAK